MTAHKVLDLFANRQGSNDSIKIEFSCKSLYPHKLPEIKEENMNSKGSVKVMDVIDFIFF